MKSVELTRSKELITIKSRVYNVDLLLSRPEIQQREVLFSIIECTSAYDVLMK